MEHCTAMGNRLAWITWLLIGVMMTSCGGLIWGVRALVLHSLWN